MRLPYYRLKESYRDVPGHVHSLILINIGFEPSLTAVQVQKIAFALTERFKDSGTNPLFDKQPEGLTALEQAKADELWQQMKEEGGIDRFDKKEQRTNTIRCQLKREGESCYWTETVRRMRTQKLVTTEGRNPLGHILQMRQCGNPSKQAAAIYDKLKLKHAPFRKIKICRTQSP